jgi:hypothetical protein
LSYLVNPIVNWLLSHAYGQGGTVAVPYAGSPAVVPRGPFPPGVQDILNQVASFYTRETLAPGDAIQWCFLVGGPGNGKSEALRELASMLAIPGILPTKIPGQPVPRTVPLDWQTNPYPLPPRYSVAFINDASIPRADADPVTGPGSLFLDLQCAVQHLLSPQTPIALLVNVNRGILVEEANFLQRPNTTFETPAGNPAAQILRWLACPSPTAGGYETSQLSTLTTVVPAAPRTPYYGQIQLAFGPAEARLKLCVHIVFLDTLSMLEPTPMSRGATIDFSAQPPKPADYNTLGSLRAVDVPRDLTTAGQFIAKVVAEDKWGNGACKDASTGQTCEAFSTCPFAQNTKWLQNDSLHCRFLDALRATEVAAGKRFTYRELLEHLSLAIIGKPEPSWLTGSPPCEWTRDRIQPATKAGAFALASHRIYANLFAVSDPAARHKLERPRTGDTVYAPLHALLQTGNAFTRPQAFARAFTIIDPARDTNPWNGDRTKVLDAVESLDVINPSDQASQWPGLPADSHSDIERTLDQVLREEIATELHLGSKASANRVRALRRWRSLSLLLQFGLAQGQLAFGDAIQAWLAEQELALREAPRSGLGDGIYRLIMPSAQNDKLFLAPLRPRTYCLVGTPPKETILTPVSANDLQVVIIPYGDSLLAEVQVNRIRERLNPLPLATLVVDLSIAREALLHAQQLSRSFTEIGHTAFARIERARASLVSRTRSSKSAVYFTDDLERLFMLTPSPAGVASVRVQSPN